MHIWPLTIGLVLVSDPEANVGLVDRALEIHASDPRRRTATGERAELSSMRENTERPRVAMAPVLDEIRGQLEHLGLTVMRAPGVLESTTAFGAQRLANFMNTVPGTASEGGRFYMTNATNLPSLRSAPRMRPSCTASTCSA